MKKIFTSFMVCLAVISMSLTGVFAASNTNSAVNKAISYYQTTKDLSADTKHVIAAKALGIDVDSSYKLPGAYTELDTSNNSEVAKAIIAMALLGEDPTTFNDTNLVSIIENNIEKETYTDNVSYMVLALYVTNSSKLDSAINYLMTFQNDDGTFGYAKGTGASLDSSALALEVLSVTGKTSEANKLVTYFNSLLQDDGHYKLDADYGYGPYDSGENVDTQAVILASLKAAGQTISDKQISYLLQWQLSDGSFKTDYSDGKTDAYATQDAFRALGTIKNGSVFVKAKEAYQASLNKQEEKETKKEEVKTTVKEETKTTTEKKTTTTKKTSSTKKKTVVKNTAAKTSDDNQVLLYGLLMFISAFTLYKHEQVQG